MPRGRKGGALEDFRLGYGRCIIEIGMWACKYGMSVFVFWLLSVLS